MGRIRLAPWLRRGLEAGLFSAVLALATVLTWRWDTVGEGLRALPPGLQGSVLMALPVLSIGVFAVAYPIGLVATRHDAILGGIAGFLVAADVVAIVTVVSGLRVVILDGSIVAVGLLAAVLALVPALAGLLASQLLSPVGFGRRAGGWAAIAAAIVATPILVLVVPLLA
ncbi:MAG: hypothetical protein H6Q36_1555 [Chloroflexi bacterium]|nr:hypothetical protein [Chloroflexota bacterium]